MSERPIDAITLDEAALILGRTVTVVRRRYIAGGALPQTKRYRHRQLSRGDVEKLACEVYRWRLHLDDDEPYWVTGKRAASIVGVNATRLRQLSVRGFVPFETHADGTRLYRREQLEVVGHGRTARWGR